MTNAKPVHRWRNLLLAAVAAALCLGGTFVCKTSTHDSDPRHGTSAIVNP